MTKRILMLALVCMVASGAAMAQLNIAGTDHDLSSNITAGPQQICVFCHTPHNANLEPGLAGNAPLWNHAINSGQDYGFYTSPTMDATGAEISSISSSDNSGLCMGCHDGTLARGALYNQPNNSGGEFDTSGISAITGSANLGTDLSNDHPVNFAYADAVDTDTELATEVAVDGLGYLDGNGFVQCSSCHDPHTPGPDAPDLYFMNETVAGSQLCADCHLK